ncbi:MAG TPA: hypothetical protein RMG48_07815 [Myxococcales bacterium LLY-WYZ-16_1]|nr:hypothetical protein [Myxococcales bacterium LLY-WYZ-16_1]
MLQTLAFLVLSATPKPELFVGDPIHGRTQFTEMCGAEMARATLDPATWNARVDAQLHAQFMKGQCGPGGPSFDPDPVSFLDAWDMVAFARTRHLRLADFFAEAARYIHKEYTIDKFGVGRLKDALGRVPRDLSHRVYTFFRVDGEEGNLSFVPQDPILLDELNKDMKIGYLVFVPFSHEGTSGQLAVAMDETGKIQGLALHRSVDGAGVLNPKLATFEGQGKLGQSEPLEAGRNPKMRSLSQSLHAPVLTAWESVTMYIREERDRTWGE